MRLDPRIPIIPLMPGVCDQCRPRRHGYHLRCLEPAGHDGPHRWTPELLDRPARPDRTRPPIQRATRAMAERLGRILDRPPTNTEVLT